MAWQQLQQTNTRGGRKSSAEYDDKECIRLKTCKGGTKNKAETYQFHVTCFFPMAKKLRWLVGDRIGLFCDGDIIGIGRVNKGGWTLTPADTKFKTADNLGKIMKCTVKMTVTKSMSERLNCNESRFVIDPLVDESGIVIIADLSASKNGQANRLTMPSRIV